MLVARVLSWVARRRGRQHCARAVSVWLRRAAATVRGQARGDRHAPRPAAARPPGRAAARQRPADRHREPSLRRGAGGRLAGQGGARRHGTDGARRLEPQRHRRASRPAGGAELQRARTRPAWPRATPRERRSTRRSGRRGRYRHCSNPPPCRRPDIATLLTRIEAARQQSDPNSLVNRPARVLVKEVTGAPGDGNRQLSRQIRQELPKLGEVVQDTADRRGFHRHRRSPDCRGREGHRTGGNPVDRHRPVAWRTRPRGATELGGAGLARPVMGRCGAGGREGGGRRDPRRHPEPQRRPRDGCHGAGESKRCRRR